MENIINHLMDLTELTAFFLFCLTFWGAVLYGLFRAICNIVIYIKMKWRWVNKTKVKASRTKVKASRRKAYPTGYSSPRVLMYILVFLLYGSLLGVAFQTSVVLENKSYITKLEVKNLDLKMALSLTKLRVKWLKRQMKKSSEKNIPNTPLI